MTKSLIASISSFLVGTLLTLLLVANPLGWEWVEILHDLLGPGTSDDSVATGQGELWTCGMHPHVLQSRPGTCPICNMDLTPARQDPMPTTDSESSKTIRFWRAPMDPTYISDRPGKSPMGMDLVPVYEGDPQQDVTGLVRIDPVFVQNLGVESEAVQRRDIDFTIRSVGNLTYDDSQLRGITTRYEGWVERVYVHFVGQPVHKGQKLFEIYSPDLVTTQKEYLQAIEYAGRLDGSRYPEARQRARSLVESTRERLGYWNVSDDQIASLERSGTPKRTMTVASPYSGLVVEKMAQPLEGMFVRPGMHLYKLVDLSTIWVEADIFESQVSWLKVGSRAQIELPYQPGSPYTGTVRYLYPFFNNQTRTMKVSIELANPGQRLRADMYANVIFQVPAARNVVAVPEEAVLHSGSRSVLVIDLGNGTYQAREVTLGRNGNGLWEVTHGLREQDRIVTSSQFLIDSESSLREAIRKISSDRPTTPAGHDAAVPGH